MGTAPAKQILLAAVAVIVFLEIYRVDGGVPSNWCFFGDFSPPTGMKAFRELRNRYEDLRRVQPWRNCSGEHLRWPKGSLDNIWDKREALAVKVGLINSALRNHSQDVSPKIVKPVLEEILLPLQQRLVNCLKSKPSDHQASSHLQEYKAKLQIFNTRNTQQSPACLEVAAGMHLVGLLNTDIREITRRQHHRSSH